MPNHYVICFILVSKMQNGSVTGGIEVRRIHLKNVRFSNDIIAFEVYEKESIQQLKYLVLKNKKARKTLIINLKPSEDETIVINLQELLHHALTRGRWQIFFSTGRVFGRKTALQISPKDFSPSAALTNIISMTDENGCAFFSNQSNDIELIVDKCQKLEEKLYRTEVVDLPVYSVETGEQELRFVITNPQLDFSDFSNIVLKRKKGKRRYIPCSDYHITKEGEFVRLTITVPESFIYHPRVWDVILETKFPDSRIRYRYILKIFKSSTPVCIESFHILDGKACIKVKEDLLRESGAALLLEHKEDYRLTTTLPISENGTDPQLMIVDLQNVLSQHVGKSKEIWDLYLVSDGNLYAEKRRLVIDDHDTPGDRFAKPIVLSDVEDSVASLCLDNHHNLYLFVGNHVNFYSLKYKPFANARKISRRENSFEVTVFVNLNETDEYRCEALVLKHRVKGPGASFEFPVHVKKQKGSMTWIAGVINVEEISLGPFYWDLFIKIRKDSEQFLVRVMNLNPILHHKINSDFSKYTIEKSGYIFYPYSTIRNQLSFTYREKGVYDSPKYYMREKIALWLYFFFGFYYRKKKIWLIYEKFAETAQDNSYYFFKYCVDEKKRKNVYYVIKKESPDYRNLAGYEEHVLEFMSIRHLLYLLASKLLISSETKSHAYIYQANRGIIRQKLIKKAYVFLQHGVIALKKVDVLWRKGLHNSADLFVVSSEFEKEIIKKYFKYNDKDIIITGLSRWDHLQDRSAGKKEILLMPTWRNWIDEVQDEKFIHSEFFINYSNLLNSERFQQMLRSNNITLNFYLHPKFMKYVNHFTPRCPNIRIIRFGELPINELIMRSSLLITDYSSVSWDMYYLGKPIIFFQFDIDQYNFYHGSYMDMDKDLFGDRVFSIDELLDVLNEYIKNEFKEKPLFQARRPNYFKYVDKNNSKRIYDEIIFRKDLLDRKDTLLEKLKQNNLLRIVWRILKINKKYHKLYVIINKIKIMIS